MEKEETQTQAKTQGKLKTVTIQHKQNKNNKLQKETNQKTILDDTNTPKETLHKAKEKKLKANQKLAIERIYRLFELAKENAEYTKRYLTLAQRIGQKMRVQIPKELKTTYCKKCGTLNVQTQEKKPFIIVKCNECSYEKKYGTK